MKISRFEHSLNKIVLGLIILVVLLSGYLLFSTPTYLTGKLAYEKKINNVFLVNYEFTKNTNFSFDRTDVDSIGVTGYYDGNGTAKIYAYLDNGEKKLIHDVKKKGKIAISVTGLVPKEDEQDIDILILKEVSEETKNNSTNETEKKVVEEIVENLNETEENVTKEEIEPLIKTIEQNETINETYNKTNNESELLDQETIEEIKQEVVNELIKIKDKKDKEKEITEETENITIQNETNATNKTHSEVNNTFNKSITFDNSTNSSFNESTNHTEKLVEDSLEVEIIPGGETAKGFSSVCAETCELSGANVTKIGIEIEGGLLFVEKINYITTEMISFQLIRNFSNQTLGPLDITKINMSEYFNGTADFYDFSSSPGYEYEIKDDVVTITGLKQGVWSAWVYALLDDNVYISNEFSIIVTEENETLIGEKASNATINKTTNQTEELSILEEKIDPELIKRLENGEKIRTIIKKVKDKQLPKIKLKDKKIQDKKINDKNKVAIALENSNSKSENKEREEQNSSGVSKEASEQIIDVDLENPIIIKQETKDYTSVDLELDQLNKLIQLDSIQEIIIDEPYSTLTTETMNITQITKVQTQTNLTGQGQNICILDTGLTNNAITNLTNQIVGKNILTNNTNYTDNNGHGTQVTYPITKIAPQSKLIIAKVLDENGTGYASDILAGLEYCQTQNATIISMSIGAGSSTGYCDEDIVAQKINEISTTGTISIAATGNDANTNTIKSPACASTAIPVTASNKNNKIASLSNYNNNTLLVAPGTNIITVDNDGSSISKSGTSMSVPFVTGSIALLYENETLTINQTKTRIVQTGDIINHSGRQFSQLNAWNAINENYTNNLTPENIYTNQTFENQTYEVLTTVSTLIDPANNDSKTNPIRFIANATDETEVINATLYTDDTETWAARETRWNGEIPYNDTNLKLLLHFNDESQFGETSTLFKDWANTQNATCTGEKCPTRNASGGKLGPGLTFDGVYSSTTGDYLDLGDNTNLKITGDMTISAWVYATEGISGNAHRVVLSNFDWNGEGSDTKARGFNFGTQGNWTWFRFQVGNGTISPVADIYNFFNESNSNNQLNKWAHIVGVWNAGNNLSIYLNGELKNSDTGVPDAIKYPTAPQNLIVGRRAEVAYQGEWKGNLDEIAMWDRALTSTEIANLYNYTKTKFYPVFQNRTLNNGTYNWNLLTEDNQSNTAWASSNNTFTVGTVNLTSTLITPLNSTNTRSPVTVSCKGIDETDLVNVTLYGNFTGSWNPNVTDTLSGSSDYQHTLETSLTLSNGTYEWNCLVEDSDTNTIWATNNYTFNIVGYGPYIVPSTQTVSTTKNLTINFQPNTNDVTPLYNTSDWMINGTSFASLNMPFNKQVTSTAAGAVPDYTTNENNGTLSSSPTPSWTSSGWIGGAYSFAGNESQISIPQITTTSTSEWTVTSWIYIDEVTNDLPGSCFYIGNSGTNGQSLLLDYSDHLGIKDTSDNYYESTIDNDILEGNWNMLTWVAKNGEVSIYINGTLEDFLYVGDTDMDFNSIGKGYQWTGHSFEGKLDQVMIFESALSDAQVAYLYETTKNKGMMSINSEETEKAENWSVSVTPNNGTADGTTLYSHNTTISDVSPVVSLISPATNNVVSSNIWFNATITDDAGTVKSVLYTNDTGSWTSRETRYAGESVYNRSGLTGLFHFNNEGAFSESTSSLHDYSGNGNNLSCSSCSSGFTSGVINNSISLNSGTTEMYNTTGDFNLSAFTVAVWYKNDGRSDPVLFDFISNYWGGYLKFNSSGFDRPQLNFATHNFRYFDKSAQDAINDHAWHYIVIRTPGNASTDILNATLRIDGVNIPSGTTESTDDPLTLNYLTIGATEDGYNDADGWMDELAIYNRYLSDAEVDAMYNATKTKKFNEDVVFQNRSLNNGTYKWNVLSTDKYQSAWASTNNTFYVGNISPYINSVRIYPTTAYTTNILEGYCNGTDPNGDPVRYHYKWYNGTSIENSGTSGYYTSGVEINVNNVSSYTAKKGETWKFECAADDGNGANNATNSTGVTIQNTPPTTPSTPSIISPSTAYATSTLTSSDGTGSTDADTSDTITYEYKWTNGTNDLQSGASTTFNCGSYSGCKVGVTMKVATIAYDQTVYSEWSSWSTGKTIQNTAPDLTSIADSVELLNGGDTQTITPSGQGDDDSDNLTLVCCFDGTNSCTPTTGSNNCTGGNYNNQASPYSSMNCTYPVGTTTRTEYVRCRTYDGTDYSSTTASENYTVDNTNPSCNTSSITEGTNPSYQYSTGSTIYYNSAQNGDFTINTDASDSGGAGVDNVTYPTTVSAGGADSTVAYNFQYTWTNTDTYNNTATATVYDTVGNSNTCTFTITIDDNAPSYDGYAYVSGATYIDGSDYWVTGGDDLKFNISHSDSQSGVYRQYFGFNHNDCAPNGCGGAPDEIQSYSNYISGVNDVYSDNTVIDIDSVSCVDADASCSDGDMTAQWNANIKSTASDWNYTINTYLFDNVQRGVGYTDLGVWVKVDNSNPTTSFSSPAASTWFGGDFDVTFSDSDSRSGVASCEYRILDNGVQSLAWTSRTCNAAQSIDISAYCTTEGADKCTVESRVTDNVGLVNDTESRSFGIDTGAPIVNVSAIASWVEGTVSTNATAIDNLSGLGDNTCEYTITTSGTSWNGASDNFTEGDSDGLCYYDWNTNSATNGSTYYINFRVNDTEGSTGTGSAVSTVVCNDKDPAACETACTDTYGAGAYFASACCGDDSGEDFENSGSGNSCCVNAEVVTNGSTDSSGAFLCIDGAISSCNSASSMTIDTDYSDCGRISTTFYCDGSGTGANTWKSQITNNNVPDDCDGSSADPYGEGHSTSYNGESCVGNKMYNDGNGQANQDKGWLCSQGDGPYMAYCSLSQSDTDFGAYFEVADEADNYNSGGYVLRLGDYNTLSDTTAYNDTSYPGTLYYNPTATLSYSGVDANEGTYGDYYNHTFTWGDLDTAITDEQTYYIEFGVEESSGATCGTQTCPTEDPNDNEGSCTTSATLCVPTGYVATSDSDCCPIGAVTGTYPGKDDDGGACISCNTNNTQLAGGTGDGLCESKCGASASADELSTNSCDGVSGYVNDTCYYFSDGDSNQLTCDCIQGGSGYWNIGGETSSTTCCEDVSENKRTATFNATTMDGTADGTDACCLASTDCVDADTCYDTGNVTHDADSDGDNDYCDAGTWQDCNTDDECGTGNYCLSNNCVSSGMTVTYELPTPGDGVRQINNTVTINVSVSSVGSNVDACLLEWQGSNESMNIVGSGTDVTCNITKTTIDGTTYTFKVYANNTVGIIENETERSFLENTKPTITSVNITPTSPYSSQDLNCTVYGGNDADGGDAVQYRFTWFNDTVQFLQTTQSGTSHIIGYGNTTVGENWNCSVEPYDSYEYGLAKSDNETIVGSAPVISNVWHMPLDASQLSYINVYVNVSDPELGDNINCTITGDITGSNTVISDTTIQTITSGIGYLTTGTYYYNVTCSDGTSQDTSLNHNITITTEARNFTYYKNSTTTTTYTHLNGTPTNLTYNGTTNGYQLTNGKTQGTYLSNIYNAGEKVIWRNISWTGTETGALPDNGASTDNTNMTGNILLMHLDEASGNIQDTSGNNNDGIVEGTPTYETTGQLNKSILFDGISDFVNLTNVNDVGTGNFTIMTWFKTGDSPSAPQYLISKRFSSYGNGYSIYLSSTGNISAQLVDADSSTDVNGGMKNDSAWHQIIAVYDRTENLTVYVDGVKTGSNSLSGESGDITNSYDLLLGRKSTGYYFFNGTLDEVTMWNRTLSSTEIRDLYIRGITKLNISTRSCDDVSCDTEGWQQNVTVNPTTLSSLPHNQYFQYQINMYTENTNYTPTINNITITYENNQPPTINNVWHTPSNATDLDNITIFVNASDFDIGDFVTCNITGDLTGTNNFTSDGSSIYEMNYSIGLLSTGTYYYNVTCTDSIATTNSTGYNITVVDGNQPPAIPVLDYPENNDSFFIDTTPRFNWTQSTDPNGDAVYYDILVSTASDFSSYVINETNFSNNFHQAIDELALDDVYYWKVRAFDQQLYSNWSTIFNFTLQTYVSVNLTEGNMTFPSLLPGNSDDTADDSPVPFLFVSESNTYINLYNSSANNVLWDTEGLNTSYWQIRARNEGNGNYNESGSQTSWINVTTDMLNIVKYLNYSSTRNNVSVDIGITVPTFETPGDKFGDITFYWEVAS